MKFENLISGKLIKRYKRFLADIELDNGEIVTAHCPNSGSMLNNKEPGSPVMISPANNPKRKLKYTWELVFSEGNWVGINTSLSNKIVKEGIENGTIKEVNGFEKIRQEVKYGLNSRIDLLLEKQDKKCYVEIKNVSLKNGETALFPDAVTTRGQKHLKELMLMKTHGHRAIIFFNIQLNGIKCFSPADGIDPEYGKLLREANKKGVETIAYQAIVSPEEIKVERKITIKL